MQDFCDKLVEVIQEAPNSDVAADLSKILSRCKGEEAGRSSTTSDDSGGGGNTNPPSPPKKPPIVE